MKKSFQICMVSAIVLLSGCAGFQAGSDLQSGRRALLYGDPEVALSSFQQLAKTYPDRLYFSALPESSWTYLGRAAYAANRLPEARQALERAVSVHSDDNMGRLYLGLTEARMEDRQQALPDIENGMKGLYDWLEYIERTQQFSYGRFWDPRREIRSGITDGLKMISGKEFSWPTLIQDGEWVGRRMEEEVDLARRDERNELNRPGEDHTR